MNIFNRVIQTIKPTPTRFEEDLKILYERQKFIEKLQKIQGEQIRKMLKPASMSVFDRCEDCNKLYLKSEGHRKC